MADRRTIIGFAIAPLSTAIAVPIIFVVGWVLQVGWLRDQPFDVVSRNIGTYLVFAVPIAYVATIVLGLPMFVLTSRSHRPGLAETVAIGTLLGAIPALFTLPVANWPSLWWLSLTATSGLCTALAFWIIAVRNRNNAPNSTLHRT